MYIKLTTRCNMNCAHCCMAATKKGQDMPWEIFKAAVDHSSGYITLGGGEPTLHPEFERFLFYALGHAEAEGGVFIVTNGSQPERALGLANLAKHGVLSAALSQDPWHDPIEPDVIQAFTKPPRGMRDYAGYEKQHDFREIRDVSQNPKGVIRVGRAARRSFREEGNDVHDDCACEGDPVVDPNGDVRQCGCPKAPIVGHVLRDFEPLGDEWVCYKKVKKTKKELDKVAAMV